MQQTMKLQIVESDKRAEKIRKKCTPKVYTCNNENTCECPKDFIIRAI